MTFFLTEQHFLYKTVFSGESSLRLKNQKKKKFWYLSVLGPEATSYLHMSLLNRVSRFMWMFSNVAFSPVLCIACFKFFVCFFVFVHIHAIKLWQGINWSPPCLKFSIVACLSSVPTVPEEGRTLFLFLAFQVFQTGTKSSATGWYPHLCWTRGSLHKLFSSHKLVEILLLAQPALFGKSTGVWKHLHRAAPIP